MKTPAQYARILAAVVPLALACVVARYAAVDILLEDPAAALVFDSDDPRALAGLVRGELREAGPARRAREHAAHALRVDPLTFEALSLYGVALARAGAGDRARAVFRVAGKHASLDDIAHGELLLRSAEARDFRTAFAEFDILLRGRPQLLSSLYPITGSLIHGDENAQAELVRMLAERPPWRSDFLANLSARLESADELMRVFRQLRASAAPPTIGEMQSFLDRLVRDGRIDEAYFSWLELLPRESLSELPYLYNDRFRRPISNLPFDWRFYPVTGAKIDVVGKADEKALRVRFFGARVAFAHVVHLLALPPGTYALTGSARLDDVENERGLRWRISCNESKETLTTTDLLVGSTPWTPFRTTFVVTPTACSAQWLVLEIPARAAVETEVSGEARYKDMSIARIDSEPDRL